MATDEQAGISLKKLVVTGIRQETSDVKTFFLTPEDGKAVTCKAGQFLTFLFREQQLELRRSYSLSSAPELEEPLAITVKRIPNGIFSRILFDNTRTGDVLTSIAPGGFFTLPDNMDAWQQLFFFAAGVGITPVYSIIKTALKNYPHVTVVLLYSNTSITDTVFYEEIEALKSTYKDRFTVEYLFSTAKDLTRARLNKWLLPSIYKAHHKQPASKQLFYTCGPFNYMRMVVLSLEELGISQTQIRKENFDTTKPKPKNTPPDTSTHGVKIHIVNKNYSFPVQYPDTILQTAKKKGISLPYSCEVGQCGSCVAQCTSGKVWMSYNEVLTDDEIEQGKVLTCVGHPIGGDVTLDYPISVKK